MISFSIALAIVLIMFLIGVSYEREEVLCELIFILIAVSAMYGIILMWV